MRSRDFAGYKLLDTLEGAPVGELYKAFNYDTKDMVSLLLLPEELHDLSERDTEFLLHDLRAVADAKLTHHGLVNLVHVAARQGRHYVELEYVKGRPLAQYVKKKGPLSPEEASRILRSVAEALDVAHRRYVIHRCVSPNSILVLDDGEAKLGHFGIARLVGGMRKLLGTKADKLVAKELLPEELYLSPEQRDGFPGDERSDIYGLGTTLYFMLKGHAPTDLSQIPAPGAAPPLYELVRRMTILDPRKRIPSCEAVLMALDHLDELAAGTMPSAPPPSPKVAEAQLPADVGGDPSDTLLWDTKQLDTLRSRWQEDKFFPEFQPEATPGKEEPTGERRDAAEAAEEIEEGYRPAFQPLEVDESAFVGTKKSAAERGAELASARKRANVQMIFGIALNLILFIVALKLALPLIERYKTGSAPAPAEQKGPRSYGQPTEQPTLPGARPIPLPRQTEAAPEREAPKAAEKPLKAESPEGKAAEPRPPAEDEPADGKPAPKKKPATAKEPTEKDPMKADFMKDEPYSYYQDPDWAKKGKNTVRIVIPDWHKKKDDASATDSQEPKKTQPDKPKKETAPAPSKPKPEE